MGELANCVLPPELLYHVEYNLWLRDLGDGRLEIGMTDIAQSMAGNLIHCQTKKVGRAVKQGKGLATIESGKWVGPLRSPFACEISEVNEAVVAEPTLVNRSPYRAGWIVRVKPQDFEQALSELAEGPSAVEGFRTYMAENEVTECTHCEGFEA